MTRFEPTAHDDLAALRDLPPHGPPAAVRERVLRLGLRELAAQGSRGPGRRVVERVALPGALAATVVVYLAWAVTTASALYRR